MSRKTAAEASADTPNVSAEDTAAGAAPPPAAIVEEQPVHGGSYVRDPETGALSRVEGPEIEPATKQTEA